MTMSEPMKTAEEFLSAFNAIEHQLKKMNEKEDRWATFGQRISALKNRNPVIRRYSDDLLEFAELRNAIVHSRRKDTVIAYPTTSTVIEINRIAQDLLNPQKVIPLFGREVLAASEDQKLSDVLRLMTNANISQVPVIRGNTVIEVLNGNSIARWLGRQEIISPGDVSVADILPDIEVKNNYRFLARTASVFDAAELYQQTLNQGWYADAIFITDNGRNGQKLLGIVVLEDIAPYLQL